MAFLSNIVPKPNRNKLYALLETHDGLFYSHGDRWGPMRTDGGQTRTDGVMVVVTFFFYHASSAIFSRFLS